MGDLLVYVALACSLAINVKCALLYYKIRKFKKTTKKIKNLKQLGALTKEQIVEYKKIKSQIKGVINARNSVKRKSK